MESLSESSAPQSVILNDYKLAVKFFMNKDFEKSYQIILKLHNVAYRNFAKGTILEEVFIKIVTLYLTELGLLLNSKDAASSFQLSRKEKKELIGKLRLSSYLDSLHEIYGSVRKVPSELLYQVFLVNYSCQHEIKQNDERFLVKQFDNLYSMLDFHGKADDKYLKRLVDMYIFNVLPDADDFYKAQDLVDSNPLVDTEKGRKRIKELKEVKKQEKKLKDKQAKEREAQEAQRLADEQAKKKAEQENANLKYKSLKQIKREHENSEELERQGRSPPTTGDGKSSIQQLRHRLEYLMRLTQRFCEKNYPVLIVLFIASLIAQRFIRTRRINVLEKLQETFRMAFKITYL